MHKAVGISHLHDNLRDGIMLVRRCTIYRNNVTRVGLLSVIPRVSSLVYSRAECRFRPWAELPITSDGKAVPWSRLDMPSRHRCLSMYDDEATLLEEVIDGVKTDPYVPLNPL